jgi:hypothetical protein
MFTGLAKLPAALLSCTVKVFPAWKEPGALKDTTTVAPEQKLLPCTAVVNPPPEGGMSTGANLDVSDG